MNITPYVRQQIQPGLDELIAAASKVAAPYHLSTRAVLNMCVVAVSAARRDAEPLDFIPVGDA